MNRKMSIVVVLCLLGCGNRILASDPTGIYAVIDRVTFQAVGTDEETVRIDGTFSLAFGRGFNYKPPVHGYMYFGLLKGKEAICRKEWADFKRVAGTNQCIAFASRYRPTGRIFR